MSLGYITMISGLASGQAANLSVQPRTTSGAKPVHDVSATAGPIYEDDVPGTYWCLLTYPPADVTLPAIAVALWSLSGTPTIVDPFPIPLFPDSVSVASNADKTGYTLSVAGLDNIVVETGLNARQALSIIAAADAGVGGDVSGTYKGAGVGISRITFTAGGGERTAVTLAPPA